MGTRYSKRKKKNGTGFLSVLLVILIIAVVAVILYGANHYKTSVQAINTQNDQIIATQNSTNSSQTGVKPKDENSTKVEKEEKKDEKKEEKVEEKSQKEETTTTKTDEKKEKTEQSTTVDKKETTSGNDEEKAIKLAKEKYGTTDGVYFRVEQVQSNGVYIISVRDSETTRDLQWYTVNVVNNSIE